MEGLERPVLDVEIDSEDLSADGDDDDSGGGLSGGHTTDRATVQDVPSNREAPSAPSTPTQGSATHEGKVSDGRPGTSTEGLLPAYPNKRPRRTTHQRNLERVSQFLLNPFAPSVSLFQTAPSCTSSTLPAHDLATHLLITPTPFLPSLFTQSHPPTRLQLLAAARPGGETDVGDEELFEEGEMEGIIRDASEVEAVRIAMGWDQDDDRDSDDEGPSEQGKPHERKRKRKHADSAGGREVGVAADPNASGTRTKRINMDALTRLLDLDTHLDEDGEDFSGLGLGYGLGPDSQ